ncbi:MAG: hypothetical protein GC181_01800 [Bacteroidetes bacterium]|nr:hypothetical protein [Bacteroidota bacterium]
MLSRAKQPRIVTVTVTETGRVKSENSKSEIANGALSCNTFRDLYDSNREERRIEERKIVHRIEYLS